MQHAFTHKQIIDSLKTYYGIHINELEQLSLSANSNASTYKANTVDQSYFVKLIYNHEHDAGLAVLALLQQAKIPLIIPPVLTLNRQLLQRIDNTTLIVQPFIDGENGFSHSLSDDQWINLGKSLKFIHEIDVPFSIQTHLRRETFSPKWRLQVKNFYHLFEDNADIDRGDEISKKLLDFLKVHKASIHRLVNRAEELAQECQIDISPFVLCHADLHGGNVLIDNHQALYIVDWDDPMLAPKERDLMFIGGGVGNVWNKQNEIELFYKGYGEVKIDMKMLAYYRHERIVEDIAIYIQQILFTSEKNKSEIFKHFVDMFNHRGVVEMAFETKCA
jgi:spectinomycin phosphotransferase